MSQSKNKPMIGDIFWIHEGTKERPVVMIAEGIGLDIDVYVARVTSTTKLRDAFDVALHDWQAANLNRPSVVRCSKLSVIDPGTLGFKAGTLTPSDLDSVLDKSSQFLALLQKQLRS